MTKPKRKALRVLGIDTSLSSPGLAVIEVIDRKPSIVALSHVKTDTKELYAQRTHHIEAWAYLFFRGHRPYDVVVRESFAHKIPRVQYGVFSGWSAIDRALHNAGLRPVDVEVSPTEVKRLLLGKGKGRAEKDEVAERVRELTGYDGAFDSDDCSDAAAIGLAHLIKEGLIDG